VRALVTGASGFIGSRLVEAMLAQGVSVRGTYRGTPPDIPGVLWSPVRQLADTQQWPGLLAGIDAVVHLAALVHQRGSASRDCWSEFQCVNVEGTRVLARACRDAGVHRLVFLSSISVHGRGVERIDEGSPAHPEDDYGRSKLAAEEALRAELARGVTDWCILRPPLVYGRGSPGNMSRLQTLVASGLPLPFGAVNNRRSFIFVDNLVDAIMTVLRFPHDIRATYLLADGSDFATPELVSALAAGNRRRVRLLNVPVPLLRALGRVGDFTARALHLEIGLDSRSVDSLVGSLVVNGARFREAFAWQPPVAGAQAFALVCRAPPWSPNEHP
jgi:nucleoside-diphosphate-sugar epimerase